MAFLDEAQLEIACVDLLKGLGYGYAHGPQIAHDGEAPERQDYAQVVLTRRLRDTLLPKLLSGEIELPEVEAIAEEVGL
jgi:type I restriction enzyme, R subunit